jgi:hypothetical protein
MSLRSPIVKRAALIALRLVWLVICLTVLIDAHRAYQGNFDWKTEEYLAFEMVFLSFPASLLVVGGLTLAGATLSLFGLELPPSSKAEMTATWFFFVVAGYAQWFLLVPKLWRKTRSPRAKKASP